MSYKRLTKYEMSKGVKCVKYWQYSQEQIAERLALLEDKIENGTLIELPCKVGDTIYFANHYRPIPRIEEHKVYSFSFGKDGLFLYIGFDTVISVNDICLTKAEAEKKLEELSKNP